MNKRKIKAVLAGGIFFLIAFFSLTACGGAADTVQESVAYPASAQASEAGKETAQLNEDAEMGEAGETAEEMEQKETETGTEDETGSTQEENASDTLQNYLTQEGFLDLEKLQKINPDIYAWIDIEGTGLSFPLLQSAEDEAFYLTHNESGEADDGGSIYTEYFNRKDFSDPNTVIYGRNVEGRFAGLHQFQDRDFFDSHRAIKIYLSDRVLEYRIFAAYTYDDRHLIKIYDFWNKDIFSSYLQDVFSQRAMDAYLDDSVEVTADDRIITLSTGVTGQDDRRYLVQAVLVSE